MLSPWIDDRARTGSPNRAKSTELVVIFDK